MNSRSRSFPFSCQEVVEVLSRGLPSDALDYSEQVHRLVLRGPFPLYEGEIAPDAPTFQTRQTGWRGLILVNDRPTAVVDFSAGRGRNGEICALARGRLPAESFASALYTGLEYGEDKKRKFSEIRFLRFSGPSVTAVWLHGRNPVFVPTRVSPSRRPQDPMILDGRRSVLRLVRDREQALAVPADPD